jgi:hypothetical protein
MPAASLPRSSEQGDVAESAAKKGKTILRPSEEGNVSSRTSGYCYEVECNKLYANIYSHRYRRHGGGAKLKKCNAPGCDYDTDNKWNLDRHIQHCQHFP